MLTLAEREEIALAHARGEGVRAIARLIGRDQSVISRELARNTSKRGYRATTAHQRAKRRRARPQQRLMNTDPLLRPRVLADLGRGRSPRQIAGRLKLEADDASVEPMEGSVTTGGARISHEALYTWIYALPKGELARLGVMLPSKRGAPAPSRYAAGRCPPPNRLIREYLPKGTESPQHQPYLTAIAEELNTRLRACLGFYTPQEVFHKQLLQGSFKFLKGRVRN